MVFLWEVHTFLDQLNHIGFEKSEYQYPAKSKLSAFIGLQGP